MIPSTPARFSERSFRRYETPIKAIVDAWPNVMYFDPKPYTLETFSCRLRDAMTSLRNYQWPTSVNMAKFIQIVDEVVVSTSAVKDRVAVGPGDLIRKKVAPFSPLSGGQQEQVIPTINLVDPPVDLINAVLLLHHYRLLTEPSHITTTHPVEVGQLDIAIDRNGNTYTIV